MPPEWEKARKLDFLPPPFGTRFETFSVENQEKTVSDSPFLVPFPEWYFNDFWSIFCVFFKHLLRLWANGGYSSFCNTFHVKSSIWMVRGFNLCVIFGDFSRTPSWTAFSLVFCVFRCHFWLTFGAERGSGIDFGGSENLIEKRDWKEFGKFGEF